MTDIDAEKRMCYECEKEIKDGDETRETDGELYCIECFRANFVECTYCGKAISDGDEITAPDGDDYCERCYERFYSSCDDCGDAVRTDDALSYNDSLYCQSCYDSRRDDDDDSINERHWSSKDLPQYQDAKKGKYITSKRIFSAELEMYYPDSSSLRDAEDSVPREYGISADGSLDNRGVEVQSPKLKGNAGEVSLVQVCKTLESLGMTTNRTTGLHIHLDGRGLLPRRKTLDVPVALIQAWVFYTLFEDVIVSFLPPSRRGNRYCKRIDREYRVAEIIECQSLDKLEKLWYRTHRRKDVIARKKEKYDGTRYAGINLHSLLKDKHVEIRYHSGTLNAVKILEWTNLHQTILDRAVMSASAGRAPLVRNDIASYSLPLGEKTDLFYNMLDLPARAREYFTERQRVFSPEVASENESAAVSTSSNTP